MASVLHGNCLKVPISHGHSHGAGGGGCGGHSHGHSHKGGRASKSAGQLSATATNSVATTLPRKDDPLLSHGVVNMYSTSIHTTHSRHNSFSKTLPNGANLLLDTGDLNGGTNISLSSSSVHRPHSRQNGSYTLLSIGSNDDTNYHHHHSCDSEDDEEEEEHLHEELSDDDEGLGGSDLKLGKEKDARPAGNINIRAAMIHVIGDFVQSVGVLISALVIKFYPEAKLVDPACTFVFSVIVFLTTIRIMKECLRVLLNAVPLTINLAQLEKELRSVHGVLDVHFLNVFAVSVDWNVLATHMVIDNMTSGEEVIRSVTRVARRGYSIKHVTVQIERQRKKSLSLINGHHHGNELI